MANLFVLLLLLSLTFLIWGFIAPRHLAKTAKINKPVTRKHTGLVFGGLTLLLCVLVGITAPPEQPVKQTVNLTASSKQVPSQAPDTTTTTKQVTETKPVPYTTTSQDDRTLPQGQSKVIQAGQNGVETLIYNVTYVNGQQTNKELVSDAITTQPTSEIVANGTYVAPAPQPTPSPAPTGCYPLTNGGNCYEPGEYCRNSDHDATGVAGNGEPIVCAYNNGWRWEPR